MSLYTYLRFSCTTDAAPAIICLPETKLSDKISYEKIGMPGYDVIRHDRNRKGGGVAIYWRSSLQAQVPNILPDSAANIECCILDVDIKHDICVRICCVYRPPSSSLSSWEPSFNQLMDDLSSAGKTFLVLGDFNVNLLNDDAFATKLKSDLHLSQLITELTRITKKSATLIGQIYCSCKLLARLCGLANIHLSDYSLIFCELSNEQTIRSKKFTYYRRIHRVNKEQFTLNFHALP